MTTPLVPLLIVGASVRAAAVSAVRAGFSPLCADAYADSDLRDWAEVIPLAEFPKGLSAALRKVRPLPWIYTGGLENRPGLISRLSRARPLWGNSADVLRQVRDPGRVARVLEIEQIPRLEVCGSANPPQADATWMLKPLRGSAGRGVVPFTPETLAHPTRFEPHYFQRRIDGAEFSGLFVAANGQAKLIGVARQLIGRPEANAPPAAWCGNIVGGDVSADLRERIARIGATLARSFSLQGLFGCDFMIDQGVPWLTEVNPRYTGSVELFELWSQHSWLRDHVLACQARTDERARELPSPLAMPGRSFTGEVSGCLGKMIVYASRAGCFAPPSPPPRASDPWMLGEFADLPVVGHPVRAGDPLCTVFARCRGEATCLSELGLKSKEVQSWIR